MKNITRIEVPNLEQSQIMMSLLNDSISSFETDQKVQINILHNNDIEVIGAPSLAIHQFTLKCELLGSQIGYEKQTVIKIK